MRVLFVCLGNICRSPLAEGVFSRLAEEKGWSDRFFVDSAGTGAWHVGERPDPRSREIATRNGIELKGTARQVEREDFLEFDHIVAMDTDNLRALERFKGPEARARVILLREFDPAAGGELDVPDPYYGGKGGFERVFEMVHRSCRALLEELVELSDDRAS